MEQKEFVQVRKIYQTRPAVTGHYEISDSDGTQRNALSIRPELEKLVNYKTPKYFQRKNFLSLKWSCGFLSVAPKQALSGDERHNIIAFWRSSLS